MKFTTEAKQLINNMPNINVVSDYIQIYFNKLQTLYNQFDPTVIQKIQEQLGSLLSSSAAITANILGKIISFAIALPMVILIIFITFLATYFFSKDMPSMQNKVIGIFSPSGGKKVRVVYDESYKMLFTYAKTYSLVIFITFLETLVGFSLLNVKYALILSIVCAIFDVLPILGIGAIYLPLAAIFFIVKNYFMGIAIIVLYLIVTIIRQIIEPKLVSASLGLHPVAVLAAIFIGIRAYGFIGMVYLIFIMVFYKILRNVDVL
jgi:sporulation integral membrane protein YtvI